MAASWIAFSRVRHPSSRNPVGSCSKQLVDDSNLVREKKSEAETQESRAGHQLLMQPRHSSRRDHERRRNSRRDESHSDNRPDAKYGEVKRRPKRLRNRAQYQQRDRRAAGEPMDQADSK